jgi:DNA adenine methylase
MIGMALSLACALTEGSGNCEEYALDFSLIPCEASSSLRASSPCGQADSISASWHARRSRRGIGSRVHVADRGRAAKIEHMNQSRPAPIAGKRTARPVVKWAGGKSALLPQFAPHFPRPGTYWRYFEPFLGGGAVFFHLQPDRSFLFDLNAQLIEVYQVIRDDADGLITALKNYQNSPDCFYAARAQNPADLRPTERAARFIFLNHTCYNGLYRVNRQGQFNVPFGRYKNPTICDEPGLRAASAALRNAHLEVADFEIILKLAEPGDLVYFDPPYEPLSPTSSFTSYTSTGFARDDQRRLAEAYRALDRRGCLLMLSNSSAPLISDLYAGFHIHPISARRLINSKADGRGAIAEVLITNFRSPEPGP